MDERGDRASDLGGSARRTGPAEVRRGAVRRRERAGGPSTMVHARPAPNRTRVPIACRPGSQTIASGQSPRVSPAEISADSKESTPAARFKLRIEPGELPVEMTHFDVTRDDRSAVLRWSTAQETNNAGFVVQRRGSDSDDGAFERIGYAEGAGMTSAPRSYRFVARDLGIGPHPFRLKQVDRSGAASLSESKTVTIRLTETARVTAPALTPVRDNAQLRVTVREAQPVRAVLYDVLGRQVRVVHNAQVPAQDSHTIRLQGDDLASGTYFVRVTGRDFSTTRRLTVVR